MNISNKVRIKKDFGTVVVEQVDFLRPSACGFIYFHKFFIHTLKPILKQKNI